MEKEFETLCDEVMTQVLNIYTCQDWECSWPAFVNHFEKIMFTTSEKWKVENIDEVFKKGE